VVLVILRCPPGARLRDRRDPGHLGAPVVPTARAISWPRWRGHEQPFAWPTLVRTIFDALGRHRGHSFSSNGSPGRWLGSCLRMAEHLEQARFDLVALAHFRERALARDLECQPSRSA